MGSKPQIMETREDGRTFGWLGVTCPTCAGCGEHPKSGRACTGCGGTGEAYGEIKPATLAASTEHTDVDEARAELEEANDEVCQQRNSGDGRPTLEAVDRLTDAVDALLAALDCAPAASVQ